MLEASFPVFLASEKIKNTIEPIRSVFQLSTGISIFYDPLLRGTSIMRVTVLQTGRAYERGLTSLNKLALTHEKV